MKTFAIATAAIALLVVQSLAQSGSAVPQSGAGHAAEVSCVILKRMGPADQVTSRLYSFGFRGKQFQYVEGKLPNGYPFHGRLTDHDVRNLQDRGAQIVILNQDFTAQDLKARREDCQAEIGKTPNQSEPKSVPATQKRAAADPKPSTAATTDLDLSSTPVGADITIDGDFVGNTPSTVKVPAGNHAVSIEMAGFQPWERTLRASGGKVSLKATLLKAEQKAAK